MDYATTTHSTENARESAHSHALGIRETELAVRKSGKRRRFKTSIEVYHTKVASRRIFVTDRNSRISYLIDTGADICVFPRSKLHGPVNKSEYELFAANRTRITTYGTVAINLNLSLCSAFKWNFTVADVKTPIIGMDFLSHYGLLVNARNKSLIDTTTQMSSREYTATKCLLRPLSAHHHTTNSWQNLQTSHAHRFLEKRELGTVWYTTSKPHLAHQSTANPAVSHLIDLNR